MLSRWANETYAFKNETLRWCLSAGAPLASVRCTRRAEAALKTEIRQGYGLTKATFCTINAPPDERIPLCVGKAVPNVEVRIVDENDKELSVGEKGQILVRGDNVMAGYLDDATASRHVMAGGWMHTGDVGKMDAESRLFVLDRIKDMILVGGRNVYPAEIENIIAEHPSVREACVVGRPHPEYGEEVVVVLVLQPKHEIDRSEFSYVAPRTPIGLQSP